MSELLKDGMTVEHAARLLADGRLQLVPARPLVTLGDRVAWVLLMTEMQAELERINSPIRIVARERPT